MKSELLNENIVNEELNLNKKAIVVEEKIDFIEPLKPEYIIEEAKVQVENEELSLINDTPIIEESIISEDIESALQSDLSDEIAMADDDDVFGELKAKAIKKPFAVKMLETEPVIAERYNELKNYILSFKKVKSRISNTADTFNMGRVQLFKLSTSGKSLKLYLNLEVASLESRFNIIDASETKAYEQVPAFLRIKSNRAMKYARELIDMVVAKFEIAKNPKYEEQDYISVLKDIANNK